MRTSIGGAMTAASYALRAQRNRPTDPEQIAVEVKKLAAQGLTPRDIGACLGLHIEVVRRALEQPNVAAPPATCNLLAGNKSLASPARDSAGGVAP